VTEQRSFLAVARIAAPHGVRGEVRCEVITDFPERFRRTRRLFAGAGHREWTVERARLMKDALLLKLEGIDSREEAERLRGIVLYVPDEDAIPLPEHTYYWHQIIGMRVRTHDGQELGTVADILPTGSNDVYVVRGEGRELLLPAIHDVIREVDVPGGVLTVELLEGLG
jgi:16S rRNA processing protein RimM